MNKKIFFFKNLTNAFKNTKDIFIKNITNIFKNNIDNEYLEQLETILLEADIGTDITDKILMQLKNNKTIKTHTELKNHLAKILYNILKQCEKPLNIEHIHPFVILIVGVNGVGKTTTVGKIANLYKNEEKKIVVVAGDTYRVAGIEQLEYICIKNNIPVIKQHYKADSASVIFDAFNTAKTKNIDILIADTSGRLHTNNILMEELKKIKTTLQKLDNKAPHEIMMIIDATFGQNSINQVKMFNNYLNLTGITINKLDGTAKAGTIFNIANSLKIPIRYIGVGEKITDIKVFDAKIYVNSLLDTDI